MWLDNPTSADMASALIGKEIPDMSELRRRWKKCPINPQYGEMCDSIPNIPCEERCHPPASEFLTESEVKGMSGGGFM